MGCSINRQEIRIGSRIEHMPPNPCTYPALRGCGVSFITEGASCPAKQNRSEQSPPHSGPHPENTLKSESTPSPSSPLVLLGSPQMWRRVRANREGAAYCGILLQPPHAPQEPSGSAVSSPGNIFASERMYLDRTGACQTLDHSTVWR